MNEIVLNKKLSIERCIKQIREYTALDRGLPFEKDYLKQDAIMMNLQRICEAAIDIANHLIKRRKLVVCNTNIFTITEVFVIIVPTLDVGGDHGKRNEAGQVVIVGIGSANVS